MIILITIFQMCTPLVLCLQVISTLICRDTEMTEMSLNTHPKFVSHVLFHFYIMIFFIFGHNAIEA